MSQDLNEDKFNCVIGIPRYHENLFQIIRNNHEWLADSGSGNNYRKRIKTPEDLSKINSIIQELRDTKSELFIDFTFHRKPRYVSIPNYISEFLRIKGIFNYYTFTNWYRITIQPESGDPECQQDMKDREILFIPLYIRLKKNKTYEQLKTIHYLNDSGTEYEVRSVNARHFMKDGRGFSSKDDGQPQGYDNVTNPQHIVDYDRFE
jgi:hypothetical protein